MLAEKGEKGWHNSDPIAYTEWFTGQVQKQGDQLRRVVRYLKAWADFQSLKRGKMSTSLILTVLVAQNFRGHERDDLSLADTAKAIFDAVLLGFRVYNPVDGMEELTQRLSEEEKKRFQNTIADLAKDAAKAVNAESKEEASKLWQDQLGDRFPFADDDEEDQKKEDARRLAAIYVPKQPIKPWVGGKVKWYKSNQRLFREERDALASKNLRLEIVGPGTPVNQYVGLKSETAMARGIFVLEVPGTNRKYEYEIALVFPDDYPKHPPRMYGNDPKLPVEIDRHIITGGQACLGAPSEIQHKWMSAPNIVSFLNEVVAPFLAWQVYYDSYGFPPEWGQRSHGKDGIIEFYAESLGLPVNENIEGFMELLARKNPPGGHEICACGSGNRLRSCHRGAVFSAREKVNWQDVKIDLNLLKVSEISKEKTT